MGQMRLVNDRELYPLLSLDYLKRLYLPRNEMLRRFAEEGVDFHVTWANVFVPVTEGMTEKGYIRAMNDIAKKMSYSFDVKNHSLLGYRITRWKRPPKNVMEDPNLLLRYSIAPDLFPSYGLHGNEIEKEKDFRTQMGRKVPKSIFTLLEKVDCTTGEKVIYEGCVGCSFVPKPEHRDEVVKILRLVKAPYLRVC